MKKKVLTGAFVLLLVFSVLTGTRLLIPVSANFRPPYLPLPTPTISIKSPENGTTYPATVPIEFNITHRALFYNEVEIKTLKYTIDGYSVFPLNFTEVDSFSSENLSRAIVTRHYSFSVENIVPPYTVQRPIGSSNHTLAITVTITNILGDASASSSPVYFMVDGDAPKISLLSPENTTYTTTDIPLTFTVNESVSWMVYSLDSQSNVTLTGAT